IIEREGIRVEIQAHPWDFCEENNETVDIVKSFRSDNVKYIYSAPHTFFYDKGKGDVKPMLEYAGDDLSHMLIADTMNHTKHCRYIVNPPGVDA
ncbi:TIM barrel protein, partial [Pantoea agglomerans]|nr:TIM barrel protein [Pantoea agglomerans]